MENSDNICSDDDVIDENELKLPLLIEQLRQMITKDGKNLPSNYRTDDEFLSIFIRVREYNVERAFIGFKKSYKYWHHNLHLYEGLRPLTFDSIFKQQIIYTLKSANPRNQSKIGIVHVGSWDTAIFSFQSGLTIGSFLAQEAFSKKSTQLYGFQVILDANQLNWSHMKELMNLSELKRGVNALQGGFPVRVIGLHIINYPSYFWILYSIIYRLLSRKIRQSVHFHETLDSLHNHFDPNILPKELGGKLTKHEAIDHSLIDDMLHRNEYFEKYYFEDKTVMDSTSMRGN